ncbi:MAG: hypothetical protein ACRCSF_11480 [Mycobacteriaceae bacterium]
MLEPNGPLPREVYVRRRALAGAIVLLLAVAVVWVAVTVRGDNNPARDSTAVVASSSLKSTVLATPTGPTIISGIQGGTVGTSNTGAAVSSAAASSSVAPELVIKSGDVCPDQTLAVKAESPKPTYKVGENPEFGVVITNIGTVPCVRDVGAGVQQALVYTLGGQTRIWSNIDCYPSTATDVRPLAPGEQAKFVQPWSGTGSSPGCPAPRPQIGPGAYQLVVQLGELRSAPVPFNISE